MLKQVEKLAMACPGDICHGFELIKKEYVSSQFAYMYTMRHKKTDAELLYLDRADENKTFAIAFKTLPEDSTGVFHILEHSVLNGSRRFPVKEPFVSMLQSSMQTFLNAMTFSDKTVFPVSSRNEQDLFNLMAVYLDAVFCPLIYKLPEIFMQEGWHYEFESETSLPYCNGVVYSEMKGAFSDVDRLIEDGAVRMLFPDTCYGYVSGGHPHSIPQLTYRQFIDTHTRFYHPSNAKIFLDGHMDIDAVLRYIDGEYLSKFDYLRPDFDFVMQKPKTAQRTIYYEVSPDEDALPHMALSKILCTHRDVEKIYAAKILADYLTGSNEAPLKRAFLENGIAQDVSLEVNDGVFQPSIVLVLRNIAPERFNEAAAFLPQASEKLISDGINRAALKASLEQAAFASREISEPYGVELALKALDGWLYGDDPLTHIDNAGIYEALRQKLNSDYFTDLLSEMLGNPDDKSCIYVLPSQTVGLEERKKETERISKIANAWSAAERHQIYESFVKMQKWQQETDGEDALSTLPHLNLKDIPEKIAPTETSLLSVSGVNILDVSASTNGIAYLNLFFDVSDFSDYELRMLNALTLFFGELRTEHLPANELQSRIKTAMGELYAKIELISSPGDLTRCKPYLLISASMLEENVPTALELIRELLTFGRYDEVDKINETLLQNDYFIKQSLIGNGHVIAITKSLSAFSKEGALKEALEGESFIRWFSDFTAGFMENGVEYSEDFRRLTERAFSSSRLFAGFSGKIDTASLGELISALPDGTIGVTANAPVFDTLPHIIDIPSDVGYSALGHNIYALGKGFGGSCSVLSSFMTYGYLWNMVRVQGGAYGTGMNIRANGDIFCYSYRDPDLHGTRLAFSGMADFLTDALSQDIILDDIIIGTLGAVNPLLSPSGVCSLECIRYLKGITPEYLADIRRQILSTSPQELAEFTDTLREFSEKGKLCVVGNKASVGFISK